jgi:hypothetical protein
MKSAFMSIGEKTYVRPSLDALNSKLCMTYPENKWITAPAKTPGFYVFDTKQHAEDFIYDYTTAGEYIYECLGESPKDARILGGSPSDIVRWTDLLFAYSKNRLTSIRILNKSKAYGGEPPPGTFTVRKIILQKRVWKLGYRLI